MRSDKRDREERRNAFRRQAEQSGSFESTAVRVPSGMKMFRIKAAGVKRVDLVPYTVGKGNPFADPGMSYPERTFYVHQNVGVKDSSYVCLRETLGKRCPICDYRKKLDSEEDAKLI